MCGIVGYLGKQNASGILLEGLKRLEYRGYDSAGLATHDGVGFSFQKRIGRVKELEKAVESHPTSGILGISHTRWATHGSVTEANAHPHISSDGAIALVHNGVIENYHSIKKFLEGKGYSFLSETDTEVLSNLIAYHYRKQAEESGKSRLAESVRRSLFHVEGTYGIAVLGQDFPQEMICARNGSPLILGIGDEEILIASDATAFARRTQNVIYLNDGEVARVTPKNFEIQTVGSESVTPAVKRLDFLPEDAELGNYSTFMEKEIFEQPTALENAMRGRFSDDGSTTKFGGLNLTPQEFRQIDRMLFCACGTAWHACLVADHLIERYARIPVDVDYASEFRYRNAPLHKNTVLFVISQSGETQDTLAALREAQRKGYPSLAINNVVGSTIARESDGGIYQHAGPEIGVASTKAFTSQLMIVSMLALYLARINDMGYSDGQDYVEALKSAPEKVASVLKMADAIEAIASRYSDYADFLFLGRQLMFPLALEGALKLKEISYIHAEGYPAAEMKHGPIALISESCPTVFLVTGGEIFQKTLANIQEVKARKGKVICIATSDCSFPDDLVDDLITIPSVHPAILPIVATVPLQLLSFYIARQRGCDVDKPRNLAKSVTVE